jgi:hypothetical protein
MTKAMRVLWENAVKEKSFYSLLHRPELLYIWQYKERNDIKGIAKVVSHFRFQQHLFCKNDADCKKTEDGIKYLLRKQLVQTLNYMPVRSLNKLPEIKQEELPLNEPPSLQDHSPLMMKEH